MLEKLGITGLSQKEVVFQIIKKALGDKYQLGLDMRPHMKPFLDNVIQSVSNAIVDHTIKSKWNPNKKHGFDIKEIQNYSSRIVNYWLRHDKRLNGGTQGVRLAKVTQQHRKLKERLTNDPLLMSLRNLLKVRDPKQNPYEVELYISKRSNEIILQTFEINISELPIEIHQELILTKSNGRKDAA